MDSAIAVAAPARLSLGDRLLVAVAVYFIGLKLLFAFGAFPIADEAYYWMWGQHPALSYFDHPPLQGWLQGLSHLVFGRSLFALRWISLAAFVGILWIFHRVALRVAGGEWRAMFLRSAVIYLASPLFGFFGSVVFIDYLLVLLMMASGYFFICYFTDVEEQGRGTMRDLLAAAILLGLAGLTKYNGAYLGLAVAGAVLVRPKLRGLLFGWQIYAAAAIALAMQAPVLIWNLQQGFASFQFHMAGRFEASFTGLDIGRMKAFAIDTASLLSPFIVPIIVAFFLRRQRNGFERVGKTLAIWVFWLSSLTFLYISNYAWVMWWWNTAAFVLILPFAGRYMGPALMTLHVLWGGVVSTLLVLSFAVVPVTLLAGQRPFMETETGYGWDAVTSAVLAAKAEHGADFIAANRYQVASQLGFALDDRDVTAISPRRDAFDDWFDPAAHRGQDAVVLVDGRDDTEFWKGHFKRVEKLGEVEVERFGYPLATYEIYFGDGYEAPN